jgi:histidyl-tRNA synthetase
LVEMLGGPKTAGVGWAAGVDRLADLCGADLTSEKRAPISLIANGENALKEAVALSSLLRNKNHYCEVFLTGNFKKKLEKANKFGTEKAILIFDQEDGSLEYKIKYFTTGEEKVISRAEIEKI